MEDHGVLLRMGGFENCHGTWFVVKTLNLEPKYGLDTLFGGGVKQGAGAIEFVAVFGGINMLSLIDR